MSERYEEAIQSWELSLKLNNEAWTLSLLGTAYWKIGEKSKPIEIIKKLKELERINRTGKNFIGTGYVTIGQLDTGFQYYDAAIEKHEPHMLFVKYALRDLGLLEDPRTKAMLDKMGVPL